MGASVGFWSLHCCSLCRMASKSFMGVYLAKENLRKVIEAELSKVGRGESQE